MHWRWGQISYECFYCTSVLVGKSRPLPRRNVGENCLSEWLVQLQLQSLAIPRNCQLQGDFPNRGLCVAVPTVGGTQCSLSEPTDQDFAMRPNNRNKVAILPSAKVGTFATRLSAVYPMGHFWGTKRMQTRDQNNLGLGLTTPRITWWLVMIK